MGFDIDAVTSLHSQILVRLRKIDFKKADVNVIKTVLAKLRGFQKENSHNRYACISIYKCIYVYIYIHVYLQV
jgi:hypothetical protein